MPIRLTPQEKQIAKRLAEIKNISGSHSPSPAMLTNAGVTVKYDFCYLSNPYATDLFIKYFRKDFKNNSALHALVEYYPSQNRTLAEKLADSPLVKWNSRRLGVPPSSAGRVVQPPKAPPFIKGDNIFVGNGATEIIQATLQNFSRKKIMVPVPTFSPYLEFAPKGVSVAMHQLRAEKEFRLETERFLADVRKEKPDTVVIINPNNPDGGFVNANDLHLLLKQLRGVETVIVDESFSHFVGKKVESAANLVERYPNLVVVKSLSKDFGIAGLRLGYGVMSEKRVSVLLERGYLWNISGFGEYFLNLLNREEFLTAYERARLRAVGERDEFFTELSKIKEIKVYPSKANMFLIELLGGTKASDLMVALLSRYGIFVRTCYDKVGLTGEFIRVASRRKEENTRAANALKAAL